MTVDRTRRDEKLVASDLPAEAVGDGVRPMETGVVPGRRILRNAVKVAATFAMIAHVKSAKASDGGVSSGCQQTINADGTVEEQGICVLQVRSSGQVLFDIQLQNADLNLDSNNLMTVELKSGSVRVLKEETASPKIRVEFNNDYMEAEIGHVATIIIDDPQKIYVTNEDGATLVTAYFDAYNQTDTATLDTAGQWIEVDFPTPVIEDGGIDLPDSEGITDAIVDATTTDVSASDADDASVEDVGVEAVSTVLPDASDEGASVAAMSSCAIRFNAPNGSNKAMLAALFSALIALEARRNKQKRRVGNLDRA